MKTLKKLLLMSIALILVTSCSKEDAVEREAEIPEGKIPVKTEVIVDGVLQTNTRASTEAGFTTGDGLYDEGDPVTVTAVANDGYELVKFYDKSGDEKYQDQSSYTFPAKISQTFKAEFARKYTITVSASPTAGGTVSGGGKFRSGKTCTLTAAANAGYSFDGWYEGSTKLSSSASYSFTDSTNRTITGKFSCFIVIGNDGYIAISKDGIDWAPAQQIGTKAWEVIVRGAGKYIVWGSDGYNTSSISGSIWTTPERNTSVEIPTGIIWANNLFILLNYSYHIFTSTDGLVWTKKPSLASDMQYPSSITYGNGMFVIVGKENDNKVYVTSSSNGKTWTKPVKITDEYQVYGREITFGNGIFVITTGNGTISRSTNGINWTTPKKVGDTQWNSIAYGNGKFVAVGFNGNVTTSTDGINWSNIKQIGNTNWNKITYGNGKFLICGNNGYVASSSDGSTWSTPVQLRDNLGNILSIRLNNVCAEP